MQMPFYNDSVRLRTGYDPVQQGSNVMHPLTNPLLLQRQRHSKVTMAGTKTCDSLTEAAQRTRGSSVDNDLHI